MEPQHPLLLSLGPAAALAGLSLAQLDKLRKSGAVFAVRLRRKHKFLRDEMWRLNPLHPPERRAGDSAPHPTVQADLCGSRNSALSPTVNPATKPVR